MSDISDMVAKISAQLESQALNAFGTSTVAADHGPLTLNKLNGMIGLCEWMLASAPPPLPRIVESIYCSDLVEDWSKVRSPSRAKRRRRMGHRQRVTGYRKPWKHATQLPNGDLVMHPVTAQYLRTELRLHENITPRP